MVLSVLTTPISIPIFFLQQGRCTEAAPILEEEIDQEMKKELSISILGKNCIEAFKQASCAKKIGKITAGSISLAMMAFSSFLIFENAILLGTPVGDLFSRDTAKQSNEALVLTQLGGGVASVTGIGAALFYIILIVFARLVQKKRYARELTENLKLVLINIV